MPVRLPSRKKTFTNALPNRIPKPYEFGSVTSIPPQQTEQTDVWAYNRAITKIPKDRQPDDQFDFIVGFFMGCGWTHEQAFSMAETICYN